MDAGVNGKWVSRQLLGVAVVAVVGLVGVIFTMVENQVARMDERMIRLEQAANRALAHDATLDAYVAISKAHLERFDERLRVMEARRP